jgi:site-specific DNA-methyltransferase (adenine-specific)
MNFIIESGTNLSQYQTAASNESLLIQGECLDVMSKLPENSVDMVLCDLPYGVTQNSWDIRISLPDLWSAYHRLCKPHAAIVLTATQPFTSMLVMSNLKEFKQELIWDKKKGSNPLLANKRIMSSHEDILVFNGKIYHPQMTEGAPYSIPRTGGNHTNSIVGGVANPNFVQKTKDTSKRFPLSVLPYSIHCGSKLHPNQKPVGLMRYLIETYTDPGMTILDNTMGSGTTGVACKESGRKFIGIESDPKIFDVSRYRICPS